MPIQALSVPLIADGKGSTVTTAVVLQPLPIVYVIVAVPADTPDTTPVDEFIVATDVLLLTHDTPGVVALLSEVVEPAQRSCVPVILAGTGLTVNMAVR
jgi:hypothetical protein